MYLGSVLFTAGGIGSIVLLGGLLLQFIFLAKFISNNW